MKYSIVVMAHNTYIMNQRFLKHLKKNTPFKYELVYVDDVSTEPNIELFKSHGAKIVALSSRSTVPVGKNKGTEAASGEFIFWLDNDCFVGEDWYKPLVKKIEEDENYGLVGQVKDARMIKKDFMKYMNQGDVMRDGQFHQHETNNGFCDFFMGYCILFRKKAFSPTRDFGLPTPMIDPELGMNVKKNGFMVVVADKSVNVDHIGSQTPRPYEYKHLLVEKWTEWWKDWEPHKHLME